MNKVSVIIANHNRTAYLPEAVASVMQTHDFDKYVVDIVIVDDASMETNAAETVKELQKKHPDIIKTILLPENKGQAYVRNIGIEACAGNYILPLDNDDVISADYIPLAVDVLTARCDVGLVYSRASYFGALEGPWELPDFSMPDFLVKNNIFNSSVFRKDEWRQVGGYDPEMRFWEDWNLWIGLVGLGLVPHRLAETCFYYRQHGDQQTSIIKLMSDAKRLSGYRRLVENNEALYKRHFPDISFADLPLYLLQRRHDLEKK